MTVPEVCQSLPSDTNFWKYSSSVWREMTPSVISGPEKISFGTNKILNLNLIYKFFWSQTILSGKPIMRSTYHIKRDTWYPPEHLHPHNSGLNSEFVLRIHIKILVILNHQRHYISISIIFHMWTCEKCSVPTLCGRCTCYFDYQPCGRMATQT